MMDEQILIEDGQVFDGSWEQLDDCFGLVNENDLFGFCKTNGFRYDVVEKDE